MPATAASNTTFTSMNTKPYGELPSGAADGYTFSAGIRKAAKKAALKTQREKT
jgi:hypothetical protein